MIDTVKDGDIFYSVGCRYDDIGQGDYMHNMYYVEVIKAYGADMAYTDLDTTMVFNCSTYQANSYLKADKFFTMCAKEAYDERDRLNRDYFKKRGITFPHESYLRYKRKADKE